MGLSPKRKLESIPEMLRSGIIVFLLTRGVPHLLTSINWWSSQRGKTTPDRTYNKQKGKLEQKVIYHTVTYNFIVQDA